MYYNFNELYKFNRKDLEELEESPLTFVPQVPISKLGFSGIDSCLYRNTYIWLTNGSNFWFYPTFISSGSMFGFRLVGSDWVYNVVELRRIRAYQCF